MSQYKLYEVAILEQPEIKKDETPGVPVIVLEPKVLMARNDQDAAVKCALKFNTKLKDVDAERIDFVVRPF